LILSGSVAFESWPVVRSGVAPIAWLAPALVPDAPQLAGSEVPPADALTVDLGGGLSVRCLFHRSSAGEASSTESSRAEAAGPPMGEHQPSSSPIRAVLPVSATAPRPLADRNATMSYTSLAELERCGYRYYLERVLGLPENRAAARSERRDRGLEARARGTIVHGLLEAIDFSRPRPSTVEDVARVARGIAARVDPAECEEIVALIAGALDSEPARLLARARHARREHPFAFALTQDEPLVSGVLDLIVEQADGSSLIVDYKSDRLLASDDLEALVQHDYGFQRLLYGLAAIEDGAPAVTVVHWFLERPQEWVEARFEASEREALRERLLARVARARAKSFAVSEVPHRALCLTCPGRGGLCSWGETRTMSERFPTLESYI
jgi:hypothetical protein